MEYKQRFVHLKLRHRSREFSKCDKTYLIRLMTFVWLFLSAKCASFRVMIQKIKDRERDKWTIHWSIRLFANDNTNLSRFLFNMFALFVCRVSFLNTKYFYPIRRIPIRTRWNGFSCYVSLSLSHSRKLTSSVASHNARADPPFSLLSHSK